MDCSANNNISCFNSYGSLYFIFFKNNLTVPKTKDLVKKPTEQYKKYIVPLINQKKKINL